MYRLTRNGLDAVASNHNRYDERESMCRLESDSITSSRSDVENFQFCLLLATSEYVNTLLGSYSGAHKGFLLLTRFPTLLLEVFFYLNYIIGFCTFDCHSLIVTVVFFSF